MAFLHYLCAIASGVLLVAAAPRGGGGGYSGGPYVWDLQPTPLTAEQVIEMFYTAVPGDTFPIFNEIPETSFSCVGHPLGYYADVETGCQAARRCSYPDGDMTSLLCPNGTLFSQAVLVCDWWFNVNCDQAESLYSYANKNLYVEGADLHESPPKDYIAPWWQELAQQIIDERQALASNSHGGSSITTA